MIKLKYQMFIRENTSQGVRLPLGEPSGHFRLLFGATDWLEVWPVDKWLAQMRTTAADLHNLMAAVRDELDARRK